MFYSKQDAVDQRDKTRIANPLTAYGGGIPPPGGLGEAEHGCQRGLVPSQEPPRGKQTSKRKDNLPMQSRTNLGLDQREWVMMMLFSGECVRRYRRSPASGAHTSCVGPFSLAPLPTCQLPLHPLHHHRSSFLPPLLHFTHIHIITIAFVHPLLVGSSVVHLHEPVRLAADFGTAFN